MADDFLGDVIQRFRACAGADALPQQLCDKVEREIRDYWAGNEVYIAKMPENKRMQRNICIKNDSRMGMSKRELAKKYKLRPRRIQYIINTAA